jgi:uncharacterized protein YfcZ (UPF0381/DUF406 family)
VTQADGSDDSVSSEQVGSIAEEAVKLLHAWSSQSRASDDHAAHVCSTTWCPVCQVVGLVRDNPDAVARVTESVAQLSRSLRDLVETALNPREES